MENKIIVISGATATGKTALSIDLAKKFSAEIINFDSLYFYNELNIGTAKPTIKERAGVPHHLIDIASAKNPINASDFTKLANPIIEDLLAKKKNIILVGGSGFYLRALMKGMYSSQTTPLEIETKSNELFEQYGIDGFIRELEKVDPEILKILHRNDHYRLRRALEHFWTCGTKYSEVKKSLDANPPEDRFPNLHLYLKIPKEEHLKIIEKRSNDIIDSGLVSEVEALLKEGFTGMEKPMQSIGYKEAQDFLSGELSSKEEFLERLIISTRQLAKAQKTWFQKVVPKYEINPLTERDKAFELTKQFLSSN